MLSRLGRSALLTSSRRAASPTTASATRTTPARPTPAAHVSTTTTSSQQASSSQSSPSSSKAPTPMEDAIRTKIAASLSPTQLRIANDSHLHAHHAAMQAPAYAAAKETHFRVHVVSDAFAGKMQPARHRMVYRLLTEEMQREGGVHALQLVTRTPEEEEKKQGEQAAQAKAGGA